MKADTQLQWRLLDLQSADTRLAQITHRVKNLPEQKAVTSLAAEIQDVDSQIGRATIELDDLRREQAKAEADVTQVRDRAARNQQRLDAGQGSAKDLQALTHELESLARRQGELEEIELEVMERVEQAERRLDGLRTKRAPLGDQLADTERTRDAALAELETERQEVASTRQAVAAGIGGELLALYEKIRAGGGVGAAALRQRRCEGCNLELMAADLARVAKAAEDDVVRCEECRCILVRTAESGL